uniref:ABC transporter n=1 Tax=Candidatus Kentrum sp. LPFa TaxID=2126335 RepID=A0A450W559_9GAMM|nr:MAG: ABC transporter [Candidatus Kentron sp. LPFa]
MIKVRNVYKAFGETRALDGVSLDIGEGELVALFGDNGSGKSTLVNIIAGHTVPDKGTVSIKGTHFTPEELSSLSAVVTQEPELADDLSVLENILLGLTPVFVKTVVR